MRAAVFKGPDRKLEIETIDDVRPEPHQLLLKVHHCGICGSDLHST